MKSRRMRWAGHVACMEDRRVAYRVWWGNVRARDHSPRHRWEVKLEYKINLRTGSESPKGE
jgi:hypothetical protein